MATYNKIQQFVEDLAHGVHNLSSDTITLAFCAAANAPVATNEVLLDLTVISAANMDDVTPTVSSSGHTTGTYALVLADHTITASGTVPTFRYVVHYNDTPTSPADPLIQWYDHGSDVDLATSETYDIDYNASGLFTLA